MRAALPAWLVTVISTFLVALITTLFANAGECLTDINDFLEEPSERIIISAEVIDRNAQLYNSMLLTICDAEDLQWEIYNMTLYSGMDKFPGKLAEKSALELIVLLEPESLNVSEYKENWNLGITDLLCMLELGCKSVCKDTDCTEFESVQRGSARLPLERFEYYAKKYLETTEYKLDLFLEAYKDSLEIVDDSKRVVLKQQETLHKNILEVRPHITSDYNLTRQILTELDKDYCSKIITISDVQQDFYTIESVYFQFQNVVHEIETGPRFTNKYQNFLFNRIQKLTNASYSLSLMNERMESRVIPSVDNHLELSHCILDDVNKQVDDALNLASSDKNHYEIEAQFCRSKLTIPRELDSEVGTARCLVDYVLKPISGELIDLQKIEEKFELTQKLIKIAYDPLSEKTELLGEQLSGENLEYYLSNFKLQNLLDNFNDLSVEFQNIHNLGVKDYHKNARKIEDELDEIILNLRILDNDAHERKVNFLWNEVELETSKIDLRLAWLGERGVNASVNVEYIQEYLDQNSRFKIEEISSFRAFGHMNRLRQQLSQFLQQLQEKRIEINPLVASTLQPRIEFEPIQAKINTPADVTFYIVVDNPFPDEEFSKKITVSFLSKTFDVLIGKKGYSSKFQESFTPITGSELSENFAFNYPSNTLIISKKINFDSNIKSNLEVPLMVVPYDFDCGEFICTYTKKSLIIHDLEDSGRVLVRVFSENPLNVELGERVDNNQIISITNNVPVEINASVTILTDDPTSILTDMSYNNQLPYSYDPSTKTLTFTILMSANSIKWVQITSSAIPSLLEENPVISSPIAEIPSSNHTYAEIHDLITRSRENYHLIKFARNDHPKLILVNLDFLNSLLSSAQSKLSHESSDAYNSAVLVFNETQNSTREVAQIFYDEIMSKYSYIKESESNFTNLPSDSIVDLSQNTTQLDVDVKKFQSYYEEGDVEDSILFGSQLLRSINQMELPQTTHYEQVEERTTTSYLKSKSLFGVPFAVPWWVSVGALVGIICLTLYVFKDNIAEVGRDIKTKFDDYEKDLQEQEMAKYNI